MVASIMFGPSVSDLFLSAVLEHLKQMTDEYDEWMMPIKHRTMAHRNSQSLHEADGTWLCCLHRNQRLNFLVVRRLVYLAEAVFKSICLTNTNRTLSNRSNQTYKQSASLL